MKTGSYFTTFGQPGRVGISLSVPESIRGTIPEYKKLAPGRWFLNAPKLEYRAHYLTQLSKLDPQQVYDDLCRLGSGSEPIILCYEKPPFTESNWCHRRIAAEWLETKLGIVVPEFGKWSGSNESNVPTTGDLFA